MATLSERVEEKERQLEKTIKKMEQLKEQVKQLKAKKAEDDRKTRTHNLIVCGAEIASLYGRVLSLDEVHMLVNHLRAEKENGVFDIWEEDWQDVSVQEQTVEIQEEKEKNDDDSDWDELFNF